MDTNTHESEGVRTSLAANGAPSSQKMIVAMRYRASLGFNHVQFT